MKPGTFIVFDVETTGFSPIKNEIIQFCAQKFQNYQKVDEICIYIKQKDPLPDKITELTGITDQILAEQGVDPAEAYLRIHQFCNFCDIFVGHNINSFDWPFLMNFCDKYTDGRPFHQVQTDKLIDTMKIGKQLNSGRWPKLALLCRILGLEFDESKAHNALYDVDRTAACLLELIKRKWVWA